MSCELGTGKGSLGLGAVVARALDPI